MSRGRFLIAAIIAVISLVAYFGKSSENPVTGEVQRVGDITPDQEVALGLQAAPEMAQQFGGLSPSPEARQLVADVCARLVSRSSVQPSTEYYRYDCHLLADQNTVNAAQVFYSLNLTEKDGWVQPVIVNAPGAPPVDFNAVMKDAFVQWLGGPGKNYQIVKNVPKK